MSSSRLANGQAKCVLGDGGAGGPPLYIHPDRVLLTNMDVSISFSQQRRRRPRRRRETCFSPGFIRSLSLLSSFEKKLTASILTDSMTGRGKKRE